MVLHRGTDTDRQDHTSGAAAENGPAGDRGTAVPKVMLALVSKQAASRLSKCCWEGFVRLSRFSTGRGGKQLALSLCLYKRQAQHTPPGCFARCFFGVVNHFENKRCACVHRFPKFSRVKETCTPRRFPSGQKEGEATTHTRSPSKAGRRAEVRPSRYLWICPSTAGSPSHLTNKHARTMRYS